MYFLGTWAILILAICQINTSLMDELECISTNEGIHVEKIGLDNMAKESLMISIIIKMEPHIRVFTMPIKKSRDCMALELEYSRRAFISNYKALLSVDDKFTEARKLLLLDYITNFGSHARNGKRQVLSFIGGLLLGGGLGSGLTELQISKMQHHVKQNSADIETIKHELTQTKSQIAKLGQYTIALIKNVREELLYNIQNLDCQLYFLETIGQTQLNMIEHHKTFDEILWTAISGNNNLYLTPKMLDPLSLQTIVNNMTIFENLIYRANSNLLYATSTISLAEISEDLSIAHFILTFPRVLKSSSPLPLYQVHQVGMYTPPSQCTYFNTPSHIIWNGKNFQPLTISNCVAHNKIHLCKPEALKNSSSCIQNNNLTCTYKFVECTKTYHNYNYVTSLSGILIRNNQKLKTFARYYDKNVKLISISEHFTTFVNWTNITEIFIGDIRIVSPNIIGKPISMVNYLPNISIPIGYYKENKLSNDFNSLSNKYNKTIEELLNPVLNYHWQNGKSLGKYDSSLIYIVLFVSSTCAIISTIWLLLLTYYIYKNMKKSFNTPSLQSYKIRYTNLMDPNAKIVNSV